MLSIMRDYTSMVKKASVSESERHWLRVLGTLNEAQARVYVAQKALAEGRGAVSRLARLTKMSRPTILKGIAELESGALPAPEEGRIRAAGGGRKRLTENEPELKRVLARLVEANTAGDPMSYLLWTNKSSRALTEELARQGYAVSHVTVTRYLREMGYSLQANVKTIEGTQHPDRDEQFRYLNQQVRRFVRSHDPVVSVDTKKKELIGVFDNRGRRWQPEGAAEAVNVHDFPTQGSGKAIPYGTYDVTRDEAVVNVGITHETAEFAVESIRRWWQLLGRKAYPQAERLLICADAGGSNGTRPRAWKVHLQALADRLGMAVTVCHYPPGTSKWNKVEHRLFSFISMNWRGRPLYSYEAVVNLIGHTTTKSGLRVKALLDKHEYESGQKVTDQEMGSLQLQPHKFHGDWNYTIEPRANLPIVNFIL
jgi:Rhodopirellula transposase DDE domain